MPSWLTRLRLRLRATFSRSHDEDLRHELQLHLQLLEEAYQREGMSSEQARCAAHREFGNATLIQEASHDLFSFRPLEELVHDVAYAFREMRRSVGFTLIAVGSLALGVGAVTAAFAVIDAFMLRGLPVSEPDHLVAFTVSNNPVWRRWSYAHYERWRDSADAVFDVAASVMVERFNVSIPPNRMEDRGKVRVSLVSGNYFRVLRAPIGAGRLLTADDDREPGGHPVAVISDGFWERWFGRSRDVVGRHVALNGLSYAVVGVTAPGFTGEWIGQPTDLWITLAMHAAVLPDAPTLLDDRWGIRSTTLRVIARQSPDVPRARAEAAANLIYQRFMTDKAAALGQTTQGMVRERQQHISLIAATQGYSPDRARYFKPLMVLMAIVVVVLVVACANFANLLLGRSQARQPDYAVRLALGASRWRLVRQSLTECAVLALMAGAFGLVVARWATTVLLKQLAATVQAVEFDLRLDARVVAFDAACVLLVILVGLWPSIRGACTAVTFSFLQKAAAREGRRRTRLGAAQALIAGQLALCTILLIGAGLFLRTVVNLRTQNLGFDRNVLLVNVAPGQAGYTEEAAAMLLQRVKERLAALPGIAGVSASSAGLLDNTTYWIDNSDRLAVDTGVPQSGLQWTFSEVAPGFFRTMGMPLLTGREFVEADLDPPARLVVINRTLATFLFGTANPIGRRIGTSPRGANQVVIGVVNDVKQTSPRDQGIGVVYLPLANSSRATLAVRTAGAAAGYSAMVRHELRALASDLPILGVQTIEQQLNDAIAQERLIGTLSLTLSAIAVLIACIGLHALLSYEVAQRTREIGVRLAMGATARSVVGLVLRDTLLLVTIALVIGLPLGVAATQPLTSQLYGIQPNDPSTLGVVALLLLLASLLATVRPARAAVRTDPVALLQHE